MKEPQKIKLNPETPSSQKSLKKIPMPSLYRPEWDITGQDNDDIYVPLDKNDENNSQNNQISIS